MNTQRFINAARLSFSKGHIIPMWPFRIFAAPAMKKRLILLLFSFTFNLIVSTALAQCSICSRTAEQMGEKPAKGMNAGILYLALTPMAVVGVISYRWWRKNRDLPEANPNG
jgi:hypothetical protein